MPAFYRASCPRADRDGFIPGIASKRQIPAFRRGAAGSTLRTDRGPLPRRASAFATAPNPRDVRSLGFRRLHAAAGRSLPGVHAGRSFRIQTTPPNSVKLFGRAGCGKFDRDENQPMQPALPLVPEFFR